MSATPQIRHGLLNFFPRVSAIAAATFTELVRMKVFYFLLIFALVIIGNSAFMMNFSFEEKFQMLKDVALGAMSIFTSLLAILATAMLLPKDIEERTIYTILAKPVPRHEYLLGKLLGVLFMLLLAIVVMSGLFLIVLWLRERSEIADTLMQLQGASQSDIDAALAAIRKSTFNSNLLPGIVIIFMKSALLASMTLFVSSFATSSIFGIITSFAVYFIGHLQATARDFWLAGMDVQWWTRLLVALVALIFPDLQAFSLADDIVAGTAIPAAIFWKTFALGGVYIAVYYSFASFIFAGREL